MTHLPFRIYRYLNCNIALDDRTSTGIANAMRISKDKAGDELHDMVNDELITFEKVGNSKVYFVRVTQHPD